MDATARGTAQSKQDDRAMHLTAELFKKRKELLKEKAAFAEEEGNMWEHSKAILAQNIDDEENLKQSRRAFEEISKLCDFIVMPKKIFLAMDTVKVTGKDTNLNVDTFIARFETLKIRAQNDWEAMQEKLEQNAEIDNALTALKNGLNHLLRQRSLEERAEHLQKMQDDRERLLKIEHEELLSRVTMLKSNLDILDAENQELQQQSHEAETELENMLSTDIENLEEVLMEEKELQQQLHACSQECNEAVTELSRLDEQNGKVVDKERVLDEKITILKTELENLTAFKRDDLEIISLQHKSIHENLQAEMNEKMKALQDEVKRLQTELNCKDSEHASLTIILGEEKQDWSKKIQNAIATGKQLEEMMTAERTASATLRSKGVEIDIECSRLEMETKALRENNNAEMMQHEIEISDLQKYLDKLNDEEKEGMQHYEIIRSHAALIIRSAKHTHLKEKLNRGEMDVRSLSDNVTCNPDASDFGEPLSDDFKQNLGSQWITAADTMTKTLFDTTNFENELTLRKFEDERAVDSEAGKVPSDIHISQVDQTDPNTVDVKADANLGNYYPLPPSAFGSPLSTNDSPDIMTDCEVSGSELDQSVWSDFSSVVK
uniref:Uncharacterized protein n=1 Tax=Onchocerca volvulus TaxID=6282 RepID=A0A8R1TZM8_ONCVO